MTVRARLLIDRSFFASCGLDISSLPLSFSGYRNTTGLVLGWEHNRRYRRWNESTPEAGVRNKQIGTSRDPEGVRMHFAA